uniref:Uncharacterized protein n=1 Tax=Micrurus lemniscatus lemniscatus TaxID=129467 RepID=A0A2D4I7C9_MICLE
MPIWDNVYNILNNQREILEEMSTITTTMSKTGKKTTSIPIPSTTTASPRIQKTIEETLVPEKQNTTSNVNIQTSLLALQESMAKLQEMMVKNHSETRMN